MGCGIWRALGGDSRLASRPGKLRAAPAAPWPKESKKHSCNPAGCGIWRVLGGDGRLASRPFGSRIGPAVPLAERGLKNIHATLWAAGFGVPLGATFVWPQSRASCGLSPRHLGRKEAKKHSCNPVGCGIWHILGGDGRLASRPSQLRIESAVPLAKRALKNIHAALRAAGFGAPSGATVVWPQGRAGCGLRSRQLGRKGHASERERGLGARQATFVGVTIISLVAEDDMVNQLDAKERGGAGDAIGQGVVLPTGAGIA